MSDSVRHIMLVLFLLLSLACLPAQRLYAAQPAAGAENPWNVPGDVPEMMHACKDIPALQSFSRNGYLSIECGYQAILLGSKIPIAPAPHVPWAAPYGKKLRVLAITMFGNAPSDTAQLAQVARELDCDMRFVLVADVPFMDWGKDDAYRLNYLAPQAREALKQDYDVILLAPGSYSPFHGYPLSFPIFPDDVYQTMLEKVKQGTGLVFVGSNIGGWWVDKTPLLAAAPAQRASDGTWVKAPKLAPAPGEPLFAGMPLADLPGFAMYDWKLREGTKVLLTESGKPLIMANSYGAGRTVLLGWDGTLAPVGTGSNDQVGYVANSRQFEHGMAVTLQAIAYAAKAEPPVQVQVAQTPLPGGQPGAVMVTLNRPATLTCLLRSGGEDTPYSSTVRANSGETAVPLPVLPAGSYWLDVIARDAQGVSLGWGSGLVTVIGDHSLLVSTDSDVYTPGQTVQVTGKVTADIAGLRAEVLVQDAAGRLLARGPATARDGAFQFRYRIEDARVAPHQATMTVYRGKTPLLREQAEFFVPNQRWDDYENMLWPNFTDLELNPQMRDIGGFTAVMDSWGGEATSKAAAKIGIRPCRMNDGMLDPSGMQTDPAKSASEYDYALKPAIAAARKYGAVNWALQDERHAMSDAGMPNQEGCRRYRAYLQAQYGTLDRLNASWDAHYTAWTDIMPTLTKELTAERRNIAPWLDFRLYVADQGYQADKRHAEMIRAVCGADSAIGIDGFTSSGHVIPYGATDIGRLLSDGVFNFYSPVWRRPDDRLAADRTDGALHRVEQQPPGLLRPTLARCVSRASRHLPLFWFHLLQSVRLAAAGRRWTGEGTKELREGTGKALMGAKRQLDPIAILYSYPSMLATAAEGIWVEPGNDHLMWRPAAASRDALEQMLTLSGNSFGYVTDKQVEQGSLRGKKLLIIPHFMGCALSDSTCAAIKQFVSDGGMVVADMAPAVLDEHGKPRTQGGLNDLFGVTREKIDYAQRATDYLVGVINTDPQKPVNGINLGENGWYVGEWYEKNLKVTDGTALGQHWFVNVPAMVVKHTGKGQTLLLNFLQTSTYRRNGEPEDDDMKLMEQILSLAGVTPQAVTQTSYGKQERYCEINTLRDGALDYVGVYAQKMPAEDPAMMQVVFPDARETYDVRQGKYLGKVTEAPLPLHVQEAALFARLDYRITGLSLTAGSVARGQAVPIAVALATTAKPERHVVHLDVVAPDGTRSYFYTRNVELREGKYAGAIYTALNDQPGMWTITAREVISGRTAKAAFTLR